MEKKSWIYTGIMLDEQSRSEILKVVKNYVLIPKDWVIINHHSTLCYNNGSEKNQTTYDSLSDFVGSTVELTVTHVGKSNDAIAVRVSHNLATTANIPHITIAIPRSGKPVDSNYITDWRELHPFKVTGIVDVYQPK